MSETNALFRQHFVLRDISCEATRTTVNVLMPLGLEADHLLSIAQHGESVAFSVPISFRVKKKSRAMAMSLARMLPERLQYADKELHWWHTVDEEYLRTPYEVASMMDCIDAELIFIDSALAYAKWKKGNANLASIMIDIGHG